jgi:Eukaryotic aspartyl protease
LSGATWSITYGDQSSASGNVYTDTVSVGATTVAGQAVEAANKISSQFQQDTENDGLLGLAFSSINTVSPTSQLTFFDNAKSGLQSPVFTADLKKGAPGTYDFGFTDSSKHTGSISYVSVNNAQGFWEFTGTGYGVGSSSFKKLSIDGIMDTGTTLLLLPDAVVNAYYAQVSDAQYDNSQGGYTFSCEDNLPDLALGIGSAKFVVPGSYINFAPTGNGDSKSNQVLGFIPSANHWILT